MNENIHSSESEERLTHAQTTSTRPSCLPNRYKTRPGIEASIEADIYQVQELGPSLLLFFQQSQRVFELCTRQHMRAQ